MSTIIHFRKLCASFCQLLATRVPCLTYSYSDALCSTIPYCMVDTVSLNCVDCTTGPCGPSTTPCSQLNSTLCASLSSRCQWFSGNSTFVSIVVLLQSIILNDLISDAPACPAPASLCARAARLHRSANGLRPLLIVLASVCSVFQCGRSNSLIHYADENVTCSLITSSLVCNITSPCIFDTHGGANGYCNAIGLFL